MKDMIKKLAFLLAVILAAGTLCTGLAEEDMFNEPSVVEIALQNRPVKTEPVHITVGNPTHVSGNFFSGQFGSNTADLDVRTMIHGYNPIVWDTQLDFVPDPTVVRRLDETPTRNGTLYTVTLNRDLLWSDGVTPITAEDYVFSYLLLSSRALEVLGADIGAYANIVGWDDYVNGRAGVFAGIRLVDNYTFSVLMKPEYDEYFYRLSLLNVYPYPISVIAPGCQVQDRGRGAYIEGDMTVDLLRQTLLDPERGYISHPAMTCGPYVMTGYDAAAGQVDFAINPVYLGNYEGVTPYFDTVTLVCVAASDMMDRLMNGEIQILNKVVDGDVIRDGISRGAAQGNYARLGLGFLSYACEQGPLTSVKVRQAVAYCMDSDRMIAEFLQGFGMPVYGWYGIGQWMTQAAFGTVRPANMADDEAAAWDALTLDALNHYDPDLQQAIRLLEEDGWTLNADGQAFDAANDALRYRQADDGSLMPLAFTFARSLNNEGADIAVAMLEETMPQIGASLTVVDVTLPELLADYYREDGVRRFDMSFLASNFVPAFDPWVNYLAEHTTGGAVNTSGIDDDRLRQLAWDLRMVQPGDYLTYMTRWVDFQCYFNEILPLCPLYSNVYFDFTAPQVQNYRINQRANWPTALLYAYWSDESPDSPADGE